jgi:hypothetical protein
VPAAGEAASSAASGGNSLQGAQESNSPSGAINPIQITVALTASFNRCNAFVACEAWASARHDGCLPGFYGLSP